MTRTPPFPTAAEHAAPISGAGFSLVELLVAMTLGLVLLFGIVQVFTGSRTTNRLTDAQTRVQEGGRYATQLLTRELRMARSLGCMSLDQGQVGPDLPALYTSACTLFADGFGCDPEAPQNPDDPSDPHHPRNLNNTIGAIGATKALGYSVTQEASGSADWLADLPKDAHDAVETHWLRGDIIAAWGVVGQGYYTGVNTTGSLTANLVVLENKTALDESGGLKASGIALVSDCERTDVFTITSLAVETAGSTSTLAHREASGVNRSDALAWAYNYPGDGTIAGRTIRASVYPFDYKVFFICCVNQGTGALQVDDPVDQCRSADADVLATYRPALCSWSASRNQTDTLVMDIADMRVTYDGWLNNNQRLSEAAAGEVTDAKWVAEHNDWQLVDTLHIQLLATSADELPTRAKRAYTESTADTDLGSNLPEDRRIYDAFSITVANRAAAMWSSDDE